MLRFDSTAICPSRRTAVMALNGLPFAFLHDERKLVAPNRFHVPYTVKVRNEL